MTLYCQHFGANFLIRDGPPRGVGESMKSVRTVLVFLLIYGFSMWAGAAGNVAAQASPNPDIGIVCSPANFPIEVFPGAARTGTTYCTLNNPTAYSENVAITVTAGGLAYAAPGTVTVGAGQEVTFEVSVRGDQRMAEGQRTVSITARVDTATGVPCGTCTPKTTSVLVVIKQFSRLRVEADEPFKQLRPKVDYTFNFKVYNDGNAYDRFNIDVANREDLEDAGFQISLPQVSTEIEAQAPPDNVRVIMRTPKVQGWSDIYYQLQFQATSDYSVRTEGIPNYQLQMVTIYIRGIYLPGFEMIGSVMMIGLAAAAIARRSNLRDGEEVEDDGLPSILI
jgi:hypothetical protein